MTIVTRAGKGSALTYDEVDANFTTLDTQSSASITAARMPALTGDVTTSAGAVATTLATVNSNVGSFGTAVNSATVTVNAKGLITAASSQAIAIDTSQVASGTLDAARMPALTGDITTSAGAVATTLASVNANVGSFGTAANSASVTVNAKGLITSASAQAIAIAASQVSSGTIAAARMPALTGDITTSSGAVATTLATVNANTGSFTNTNITVNGKGLITAASSGINALYIPWGVLANVDWADATTYYTGFLYPTSVATWAKITIPRAGTVKRIDFHILVLGTLGTTETFTVSFRKNDTTDTTITSAATAGAILQTFTNSSLSIAVAAGDFFEIKIVTPTWATNPTAVTIRGGVYME